MAQEIVPIEQQLQEVAAMEQTVIAALEELHKEHPDVFQKMKEVDELSSKVQQMKDEVKNRLVEEKDFDLHRIGDLTVSLSAVAKIKVTDIDKVPDDFKRVETVVDEKKAREYLKIMHRAPEGCEDNSYYRLNWRVADKTKEIE